MSVIQRVDGVVFDHDGVICDSETIAMRVAGEIIYDELKSLASQGDQQAAEHIQETNRDAFAQAVVVKYAGAHFSQMLSPYGITAPKEHKRLDDIKMDLTISALAADVETFPRMREMLSSLIEQDIKIAIATSSELSRITPCLERNGLRDFFIDANGTEHVYSAIDSLPTPTPKPAPDVYLHAVQKRGIHPKRVIAVEDSGSGATSARSAGLPVIGYVGGTHIPFNNIAKHTQMLMEKGAHEVAESPIGIHRAIMNYDCVS